MGTEQPRRQRVRRRLLSILLTLLVLFVGASTVAAFWMTGGRHHAVGLPPSDFPYPIEDASWTTRDGETIKGWFVPGDGGDRALVLLHGYRGDRRSMIARAAFFRQAGYAALLYDSRAAGESTGDTVTFGYHESKDLLGALDWLRQRGYRKIACLGQSLGGATILMAGPELGDIRCAICESAFDELAKAVENRFTRYMLGPSWLSGCVFVPVAEWRTGIAMDRVRPVERIATLPCPVMILGGDADVSTLPADTQRLYDAARAPKELWMVPGAGHRDLFGAEYRGKVAAFLDRYMN